MIFMYTEINQDKNYKNYIIHSIKLLISEQNQINYNIDIQCLY